MNTKQQLKEIAQKLKKQEIALPDGSKLTIKVRPKWGKKTKATIEWNKTIDNVDFNITIQGQPIRCYQEGIQINPTGDNILQAEASATFKW